MYGSAGGLKPNREQIWGVPSGANPYQNDEEQAPPFSGLHAPGNSLTAQGPATEPMHGNEVENSKLKMAMLLAGRGMQGFAKGMQANPLNIPMQPRQALDIYGQPIQGA